MRPLYIFDIDGTCANIEHRLDILKEPRSSDKYTRFYSLCNKDLPNKNILTILETLKKSNAEIWFFTGRTEGVRNKTAVWLSTYTSFNLEEITQLNLIMRPIGDYTPDDELKESWLMRMLFVDLDRLIAVFDDRQRVVNMWRRNGITCLQVAKGNF